MHHVHIAAKTAKKMMVSHRGVSSMKWAISCMCGLWLINFGAKVHLFPEIRCDNLAIGVAILQVQGKKVLQF